MKTDRIILGIDPGTNIMGYGLIHQQLKSISLIDLGVIKLGNQPNHAIKLKKIFETTLEIIERYKPDELAIEATFFGKNVQSMLKLGRAQGIVIAAALYRDMPFFEYSPRKIKQAITGNGNASKEQVAAMLENIVKSLEKQDYLDATDALAVAVCHYFQNIVPGSGNSSNKWKSFIAKNPDRII